jgi:hypothetical protein
MKGLAPVVFAAGCCCCIFVQSCSRLISDVQV